MDDQNERATLRKIEICFPVPVELPDGWEQKLGALVDEVCEGYEKENPDRVMWPAGYGSKPQWSVVDAAMLSKDPGPDAPESGEPLFDDSVYEIDVAEREAYESEIGRRDKRKAALASSQAATLGRAVWRWMPLMDTGLAIRMDFLNEQQAQRNHSQSLQRLAERGGLAPSEAAAVIDKRAWRSITVKEAMDMVLAANPQQINESGGVDGHASSAGGAVPGDMNAEVVAKTTRSAGVESGPLSPNPQQIASSPSMPDIKAMVDRFLCWPLPKSFAPDCGISFKQIASYDGTLGSWPIGTNLFSAEEARQMFEHVLAAAPAPLPEKGQSRFKK